MIICLEYNKLFSLGKKDDVIINEDEALYFLKELYTDGHDLILTTFSGRKRCESINKYLNSTYYAGILLADYFKDIYYCKSIHGKVMVVTYLGANVIVDYNPSMYDLVENETFLTEIIIHEDWEITYNLISNIINRKLIPKHDNLGNCCYDIN